MEPWKIILGIFSVIGTLYTGLHVYFKSKRDAKIESFKSIMEESKKFREEIRGELSKAKEEIVKLQKKVSEYEDKINELSEKLKEALSPKSWLYFYVAKPIIQTELEGIIKFHITDTSDKILVVDDDPLTLKILDSMSSKYGWNFLRVKSGKTALETLKMVQPKMIVIDCTLPVSDGFELLNTIHENKDYSSIPLVILSSSKLKEVDRLFIHTKIHESLIKA